MTQKKCMLDTNVFNHILDGHVSLEQFIGCELFATHVQLDEIKRTKDAARRSNLLSVFQDINPNEVPTSTAVWDDSRWGKAKWSSGDGLYEKLLDQIMNFDLKAGRTKTHINQSRDARIAETAIKNKLVLITNDKSLSVAAKENGCIVEDGSK